MASFMEIVVVLSVVGAVAVLGGTTTGLRQPEGPIGPVGPHGLVRGEAPIYPVGPDGEKREGGDWGLASEKGLPEEGAYRKGLPVHRNARSARSAGPPGPAMSADIPPAR